MVSPFSGLVQDQNVIVCFRFPILSKSPYSKRNAQLPSAFIHILFTVFSIYYTA